MGDRGGRLQSALRFAFIAARYGRSGDIENLVRRHPAYGKSPFRGFGKRGELREFLPDFVRRVRQRILRKYVCVRGRSVRFGLRRLFCIAHAAKNVRCGGIGAGNFFVGGKERAKNVRIRGKKHARFRVCLLGKI